jgi:hypothetical protein
MISDLTAFAEARGVDGSGLDRPAARIGPAGASFDLSCVKVSARGNEIFCRD